MNIRKFIVKNIDRIVCTTSFIGTWAYIKYSHEQSQSHIEDVQQNVNNIKDNMNN